MTDNSAAWYHCTRCGSLFKASADPEQRGLCPDCGGDPGGEEEAPAPAGPVKVRRKIRKKQPSRTSSRGGDGRKAKALMVFVIVWVVLLGLLAMTLHRRGKSAAPSASDTPSLTSDDIEDQRLIRDHLDACGKRLTEFLQAPDTGAQALHVLGGGRTIQRMARVQQFNPSYTTDDALEIQRYGVIRTPAGRGIETFWKLGDEKSIEVVFFEEEGEWKIDWDAYARAGSESWPLFLAGRGRGQGDFRLLARERIGADGRDSEFISLVLYSTRFGYPGEAVSPSPEVKVERDSPMGRQIEDAFFAREQGIAPFGSKLGDVNPDGMIRLRVRVSRRGEEERVFQIDELLAGHWLGFPERAEEGP